SFPAPGAERPRAVDFNGGAGTAHIAATAVAPGSLGSHAHAYADNGSYTVTVTVTDKDGASDSKTFGVTVANVAPAATFNAPVSVNEGAIINLSLTNPTDPSSADTSAGFTYAFDGGDGAGYSSFSSSNSASF